MKNLLVASVAALAVFFATYGSAFALSTFLTVQGGTGTSTPSGILYGDNGATGHLNTVKIGSNLTFSGGTLSASGGGTGSGVATTSLAATTPLTVTKTTSAITYGIPQATGSVNGYLDSTDWNTFNNKQGTITLTTSGTSGAATFSANTLNIPQYSGTTYTAGNGLSLSSGTFSINDAYANTFTAKQTFGNASTTGVSGTYFCIGGVCRTSWPSGGSGGSIGTSTPLVSGEVDYSTGVNTIGNSSGLTFSGSTLTTKYASTTALSATNLYGSLTGNASTVTNGLYSTGSYLNPSWLTGVPYSILTGTVPTWNQNTTGNAGTATALAANGTNCSAGYFALGVDASGNAEGCTLANLGTVTSVAMSVPTGLLVSGSPITTNGTLALTLASGYNIPLTASTTNWNNFYNTPSTRITAGTGLTWSGNTLNAGTASAGTLSTETPSGTINGTNTVFTTTHQPALLELNGAYMTPGGVDYTLTGSGPYTETFVNAPVTGSNLTSLYGNAASINTFSSPLVDISNVVSIPVATGSANGYLSSTDWTTFNGKQANLSLLAGTYTNGDLCTYASTGTLLNCNTAVPTGTVTSVSATVPTGLTVSGSPITGSGTLAFGLATGYNIPLTASTTNWNNSYNSWNTNNANWTTAYTDRITSASLPLSITSNVLSIAQANTSTNGYLSSTDWNTFNGKQGAITLTTTGTSGAATFSGGTLNIPQYAGTTYTAGNGLTLSGGAFSVNEAYANTWTTAQTFGAGLTNNATSTGAFGFNITGGCYAKNGVCIGGGGGSTAPGGSSGQVQYNNASAFGGASQMYITSSGTLGIGTTTAKSNGLVIGAGYGIFNYENMDATSTSITVNMASSTSQLVRIGTAATTISFSHVVPGETLTLTTCSPNATAGAITFSGAHWSGGIQPGNSTTANVCDMWYFRVTAGTSTPIVVGTGMTSGIE